MTRELVSGAVQYVRIVDGPRAGQTIRVRHKASFRPVRMDNGTRAAIYVEQAGRAGALTPRQARRLRHKDTDR